MQGVSLSGVSVYSRPGQSSHYHRICDAGKSAEGALGKGPCISGLAAEDKPAGAPSKALVSPLVHQAAACHACSGACKSSWAAAECSRHMLSCNLPWGCMGWPTCCCPGVILELDVAGIENNKPTHQQRWMSTSLKQDWCSPGHPQEHQWPCPPWAVMGCSCKSLVSSFYATVCCLMAVSRSANVDRAAQVLPVLAARTILSLQGTPMLRRSQHDGACTALLSLLEYSTCRKVLAQETVSAMTRALVSANSV